MLLRQVWIQNFCLMPAEAGAQRGMNGPGEDGMLVRWRTAAEGFPASLLMLASPYDPDVHYAKKRSTTWIGYKVHLTETCDDERPHLITHVETTPAPVVDRDALGPVHDRLPARTCCRASISWIPATWMRTSWWPARAITASR